MIGENCQLSQMNWLSLRNNRLKFKASGELPIALEEFMPQINIEKPKHVNVTSWTCKH